MKQVINNRGITLIALVITIIVMLILVAVTINVARDGKLFVHAANAVKETKRAIEEENAILNDELDQSIETIVAKSNALYGDANLDGVVNGDDVTLILHVSMGTATLSSEQARINADVNLDGNVDSTDAILVEQYINGTRPSLP